MSRETLKLRRRWMELGFAVFVTAAVLAIRIALPRSLSGDRPLLVLFVLPTLLSAYVGGTVAGLLSTALVAAISANVIYPSYGFTLARPLDLTQWLVLVATGVLVSVLCGALRRARHRAEQIARELETRERQYRLLFEESPLPKWVYDLETLRFLTVNKAAQTHYGYSQSEFLRMTIRTTIPPDCVLRARFSYAARRVS